MALDVGGASPLFRAGFVDRDGRGWTSRRWSTRKRSEVRILHAPPPRPTWICPGGSVVTARTVSQLARTAPSSLCIAERHKGRCSLAHPKRRFHVEIRRRNVLRASVPHLRTGVGGLRRFSAPLSSVGPGGGLEERIMSIRRTFLAFLTVLLVIPTFTAAWADTAADQNIEVSVMEGDVLAI